MYVLKKSGKTVAYFEQKVVALDFLITYVVGESFLEFSKDHSPKEVISKIKDTLKERTDLFEIKEI